MSLFTWVNIQKRSVVILSYRLFLLISHLLISFYSLKEKGLRNFLILLDKKPIYIGVIEKRAKGIKQQYKRKILIFYKNHQRKIKINQFSKTTDIGEFLIQFSTNNFSRKEVEEFGLACSCNLQQPFSNKYEINRDEVSKLKR